MITQCDRGVHDVGAFRSAGAQPAPGRRPVPPDRRPAVPSPGLATAALEPQEQEVQHRQCALHAAISSPIRVGAFERGATDPAARGRARSEASVVPTIPSRTGATGDQHSLLAVHDVVVVEAYQPGALRDQEVLARVRVVSAAAVRDRHRGPAEPGPGIRAELHRAQAGNVLAAAAARVDLGRVHPPRHERRADPRGPARLPVHRDGHSGRHLPRTVHGSETGMKLKRVRIRAPVTLKAASWVSSTRSSSRTRGTTARCTARRSRCGPSWSRCCAGSWTRTPRSTRNGGGQVGAGRATPWSEDGTGMESRNG